MTMFRAYAKINLGLHVLGKRPDGYHDIETVFYRVDMCDLLSITESHEIEVVSDDSSAPSGEANICHKAVRMLRDALNVDLGARIEIHKKVPVGAGLGGGSADAAIVLREVPPMWGTPLHESDARRIALALGSDVPFFLGKGSAIGRGRGEVLEYFPFTLPFTVLLCNPGIHVSTPWAYQQVTPREGPTHVDFRALLERGMTSPETLAGSLVNDFEEPVFREFPAIGQIKAGMLDHGAVFALMSGSGSTVFGLFRLVDEAKSAERYFSGKGYRTFFTPPGFSAR